MPSVAISNPSLTAGCVWRSREAGHRPGHLGRERLIRPGLRPADSDCHWLGLPVVSEHQTAVNSERVNGVLGETAVGKRPQCVALAKAAYRQPEPPSAKLGVHIYAKYANT